MKQIFIVAIAAGLTLACAPPRAAGTALAAESKNADVTGKTLAELFEGKFTGVKVASVSANSVRLIIRNSQNIDGSAAYPLYLVDGSPVAAPDGVFSIDPSTVQKIEVLKDDASTLIYGQAAANGVVKITTKRK